MRHIVELLSILMLLELTLGFIPSARVGLRVGRIQPVDQLSRIFSVNTDSSHNVIRIDGDVKEARATKLRNVISSVRADAARFLRESKVKAAGALVILALIFGRVAAGSSSTGLFGSNKPVEVTSSPPRTFIHKGASKVKQLYRRLARVQIDVSGERVSLSSKEKVKSKFKATEVLQSAAEEGKRETMQSFQDLGESLKGLKSDIIIPLLVTSTMIPIFKALGLSPILGFLMAGTILGPSCQNIVSDVHALDYLGEIGIVFFLFEMGLELSVGKLKSMRADVFGLGLSQFLVTTAIISKGASLLGLPFKAAATVGGSLALSSSAFVLQLLKDKNAMGTRHGKASFAILLLQDLAVVPLLIVVDLLGRGGASGMGVALAKAATKALVTLVAMSAVGKNVIDPLFDFVSKSGSQEAFLSITLCTVLVMSFVTEGIGLSGTLGAFLAGLLLSETRYKYQIEADIKPFRGMLLGFFFITVGFAIDLSLIARSPGTVMALTAALMTTKASIVIGLSMLSGVSFSSALQAGWLLSQGGEFAFVAFGIADRLGLLAPQQTKYLLTSVALSMALTPFVADATAVLGDRLEQGSGFSHYRGDDDTSNREKRSLLSQGDFVIVCGYGRIGQTVCSMLDRQFIKYVAIDNSAERAIDARNKGLPVFYGDVTRADVLNSFGASTAKACILTIDDMSSTNRAVITLSREFPDLPMIVRASDVAHKSRLEKKFDKIKVMTPLLPKHSIMLTLPFGGAVLEQLGVSQPEIEGILEDVAASYWQQADPYAESAFRLLRGVKGIGALSSATGGEGSSSSSVTTAAAPASAPAAEGIGGIAETGTVAAPRGVREEDTHSAAAGAMNAAMNATPTPVSVERGVDLNQGGMTSTGAATGGGCKPLVSTSTAAVTPDTPSDGEAKQMQQQLQQPNEEVHGIEDVIGVGGALPTPVKSPHVNEDVEREAE